MAPHSSAQVLSDPKQSLLRANLVPKANVRIGVPKPDSGDSGGKALALKADLQKEVATVAEVHSPKPAANPIKKVSATDILATVSGRGGSASASAAPASASPAKPKGSGPAAGKGKGAGSQFLRLCECSVSSQHSPPTPNASCHGYPTLTRCHAPSCSFAAKR